VKLSDFILPFLISAVIHVAVLSSDILHHNAEVVFEKGAQAVTLNIVPSIASKSSSAMPAAARPAAKQSVPTQPFPSKVIVPKKAGLIQDVLLHPKEKLVAKQHKSEVQRDTTKGETVCTECISSEPNTEGSEMERHPSVSVSPQDKGDREHRPYHRTGVAAVKSKNNDGDRKEKGVTSPVVVTGLSKPEYPRYSRINGEEGTVVLIVEVLANRMPGKIKVVTSSGYRRLDCAAVKALEKASFIPAKVAGKAVASTKRIAFRFKLDE
jgi:TonB family protein